MANPNENRINTTLTDPDVTHVNDGFNEINTAVDTVAQVLTAEERESLFSLSVENLVFAQNALAQGQLLNAQFPPLIQQVVTNLGTDTTLSEQLDLILDTLLMPLVQKIKDTKRLADHERYVAALAIYKLIEVGAQMALPGFQAAYDILKVRFAGQGSQPQQNP